MMHGIPVICLHILQQVWQVWDALNKGGDINTEQMKAAAAKLKEFWNYTDRRDAIGANYSVAMNNFASGKTAMQLTTLADWLSW